MKTGQVDDIETRILEAICSQTLEFLGVDPANVAAQPPRRVARKYLGALIRMNSKQIYEEKRRLATERQLIAVLQKPKGRETHLALERLASDGLVFPVSIKGTLDDVESYVLTPTGLSLLVFGKKDDSPIASLLFDMEFVDKVKSLERFIQKGISLQDSLLLVVMLYFGFDRDNPLNLHKKESGQVLLTIMNELNRLLFETDENLFDATRDFATTPYHRNLRELRYKVNLFFDQRKSGGRIDCWLEMESERFERNDILEFIVGKVFDRAIKVAADSRGVLKRLMGIDHIMERILDKRYPPQKEFRIRHAIMLLNLYDLEDESENRKAAIRAFLRTGRKRLRSLAARGSC